MDSNIKTLKTQQLASATWMVAIAALLAALFHWNGNTSDIPLFGHSVFRWMVIRWGDLGQQFSYAWLVPPVSAWLVWRQRQALLDAPVRIDWRGLCGVVAFLVLHLLGARLQQPRLSLVAFAGLLWTMPWYRFGPAVARRLAFPCAYLLFCVPLTFLDTWSFPLRLFAASASALLLNGMGIATLQVGTALVSARPDGFRLEVADPCSGLGYLLSLLALGALMAAITQPTRWRQWILFAASIPVAVMANMVRILVIALCAHMLNPALAAGLYHYASGYVVYITAVLLLLAAGRILETPWHTRWNQWKSAHKPRT
ncbi:MAG: hypothetical protein A2498_03520 [Lentisphaerae bacterium RIFOXYC12_FULL_60_16]|nr:MAG: hypothetical protein A2498_03520 [Lentisphaerae bacterium RIFOXYC12_FULL_60_16]OGV71738.1 MAG: hypothetical protein A2269_00035 [Lentisphaerae bacterium RIFOXYA12_FULL_60_10]